MAVRTVADRDGTVFVSGIFNILHPGHVRLLRFASELGNRLVVGVLSDAIAGDAATLPESQRLEALSSLRMVDESFIVKDSVTATIDRVKPDLVVKGREHQHRPNEEEAILRGFGGRLVFSSGDSFFSVTDLIRSDGPASRSVFVHLPADFMEHHGTSRARLAEVIDRMRQVRVLVVGDVIVDEYVSCHPLGMSREDPTLVVTPVETRKFIGGAAIVAGHAASLGKSASLVSVVGADDHATFLRDELAALGVAASMHPDSSRPTTTKQRWRAGGKTLLRVSHLHQDAISGGLQQQLVDSIDAALDSHDVLIFSDFNYGALPQPLVDAITARGRAHGMVMAADSQTSSQIGDVSRFTDMNVITPTEYEARVATRNFEDGLVVLADELREKSGAELILMTLAEDGLFIRGSLGPADEATTERLPALNPSPVDVAGAGDSLLVAATMALASGASMHEAALLGSIAAAVQVSTTGNSPISREAILEAIRR